MSAARITAIGTGSSVGRAPSTTSVPMQNDGFDISSVYLAALAAIKLSSAQPDAAPRTPEVLTAEGEIQLIAIKEIMARVVDEVVRGNASNACSRVASASVSGSSILGVPSAMVSDVALQSTLPSPKSKPPLPPAPRTQVRSSLGLSRRLLACGTPLGTFGTPLAEEKKRVVASSNVCTKQHGFGATHMPHSRIEDCVRFMPHCFLAATLTGTTERTPTPSPVKPEANAAPAREAAAAQAVVKEPEGKATPITSFGVVGWVLGMWEAPAAPSPRRSVTSWRPLHDSITRAVVLLLLLLVTLPVLAHGISASLSSFDDPPPPLPEPRASPGRMLEWVLRGTAHNVGIVRSWAAHLPLR